MHVAKMSLVGLAIIALMLIASSSTFAATIVYDNPIEGNAATAAYPDPSGDYDPAGFVCFELAQERIQATTTQVAPGGSTQSMGLSRTSNSAHASGSFSNASQATEKLVIFDADIYVDEAGNSGFGAGMNAYNNPTSANFNDQVFGLIFDSNSGNVLYYDGVNYQTAIAGVVSADTWYTVSVTADLDNQTYEVNFDGNLSGDLAFVSAQSTVQRIEFYAGDNNALFYADNILVQTVPEPASAAAVGLGIFGMLIHRRR